jgi:hypothetical protein
VRTYDAIEGDGGGVAIIMELMNGPNLADLVSESGPLSADEVLRVGWLLACVLMIFPPLCGSPGCHEAGRSAEHPGR